MTYKSILLFTCIFTLSYSPIQAQGKFKKLKEKLKQATSGPDLKSDPKYHYSSIPAAHKSTLENKLVSGFLIEQVEDDYGNKSLLIQYGQGKYAGDERYTVECNQNKRFTELYGKDTYIGHDIKLEYNGEPAAFGNQGDGRKGRIIVPEEGVYLVYGGDIVFSDNGKTYFPYSKNYTSNTPLAENPVLVFAKTEALLAAWTPERAKKEVGMLEDKIKAKVEGGAAASLAAVRVPKKGAMHKGTFFNKCEGLVKALCTKDKTEFHRLSIVSDDWYIVNNKHTGATEYRICKGYFVDTNPRGECIVHTVSFKEMYNGGNYGNTFIAGVGQDPNVGPVIDCANIMR